MNKRIGNYWETVLGRRLILCSPAVCLALTLTSFCFAETPPPAPIQDVECLQLLSGTDRISPGLVETVASMLNHPSDISPVVPRTRPSLMVVSYHEQAGQARDIVVQLFFDSPTSHQTVLNSDGYVRARLGDELSNSADHFLGLMFQQAVYFGQRDEVERQQRAFQAVLNGDITLLREQTVDPLHMLIVMPHGGTFLPSSLRSRVRGLVVDAQLDFGTWSGRIGMVTDDNQSAEQVGNIVAAWREMAVSFADTFAGANSGKQLRDSLKSSTVQVVDNRVLASASVDSRTVVRTSKEITGHGGGCPPGGFCSKFTVAVCHKTDSRHEETMCVAPSAVASFLARGDHCGVCAGDDGGGHGGEGDHGKGGDDEGDHGRGSNGDDGKGHEDGR